MRPYPGIERTTPRSALGVSTNESGSTNENESATLTKNESTNESTIR